MSTEILLLYYVPLLFKKRHEIIDKLWELMVKCALAQAPEDKKKDYYKFAKRLMELMK